MEKSSWELAFKRLRDLGWSKWRISKELGVHWKTVHGWDRKLFVPNPENQEKLIELSK